MFARNFGRMLREVPNKRTSFSALVETIRAERKLTREVPDFDPENGNEQAKLLFLLEAPGPKAVETGVISFDNPDPSAGNLREQLAATRITRKEIAIWNVVPWYIGNATGTGIRSANGSDVRAGIQYLQPLIAAMPNLRCVLLVGGAARQAHIFLSGITTVRIVSLHHPSGKVMNVNPRAAQENIDVLKLIKDTA